jgi:hypothetical protein
MQLDGELIAFEKDANPLHFLTELPVLYRQDPDSKNNLDTLLGPYREYQGDPTVWGYTYNKTCWSVSESFRLVKQNTILRGFHRRFHELYKPENNNRRETALRELGLNENVVNELKDAILSAEAVTDQTKPAILTMFKYFLSGQLPAAETAAAAAPSGAADHKS